jgi:hypothetical protein
MKYLKPYKIFESFEVHDPTSILQTDDNSNEIIDIIKDRLIDLSDDGYDMNIYLRSIKYPNSGPSINYSFKPTGLKEISVRIERHNFAWFYIRDILDYINSLASHMNSNYNISIDVCYSMKYIDVPRKVGDSYLDVIRTMGDSYVEGVELTFHQRKSPKVEI